MNKLMYWVEFMYIVRHTQNYTGLLSHFGLVGLVRHTKAFQKLYKMMSQFNRKNV